MSWRWSSGAGGAGSSCTARFAGHYLDIEDEGDVIGRDTLIGALTGAVIGAAFGPPGFAAGLVAGASIGGFVQANHVPEPEGELFERIRVHVPHGSPAIALLAAPEHVDAMLAASADLGDMLTGESSQTRK